MKHAFLHLLSVVFFFSGSFFIVSPAFAVTIHIDQIPTTISADPFTVNATITGATPGTNYLRVDLYKDGTSNYFGETFNGSDWHSDSEGTHYFPITIDQNKNWQGSLQARIGNPSIHDYDGTGNYKLRIRRYTTSGNYTTEEANNNAISIVIAYPTITSTPVPTLTPIKVPTQTPTPKPTATTKPTPTNKPTVTPKPSPTPANSPISIKSGTTVTSAIIPTTLAKEASDERDITNNATDSSDVLSASTEGEIIHLLTPTLTRTQIDSGKLQKEMLLAGARQQNNDRAFFSMAIIGGGIFLLASGILLFWRRLSPK